MTSGTIPVAGLVIVLSLCACSQTQEPPSSSAPASSEQAAAKPASHSAGQIETAVVDFKPIQPELVLVGKVAYGEDRYSKISSPLQGRVVEVRAKLGDRVEAGATLLVIDSSDITAAYSEFVKEASELEYSTRAQELAKELYATKALALKDLKQTENDLIKARAEFRRAKERLLSLRIPASELEKPLAQQRITSRFEMKSPLTGTVVERAVTPGQSVGGDAGQVLFTVADLDRLQVVADVYERDLALVKVSQVGRINVEAYPGTDFASVVASIGDVVDPTTRTIKSARLGRQQGSAFEAGNVRAPQVGYRRRHPVFDDSQGSRRGDRREIFRLSGGGTRSLCETRGDGFQRVQRASPHPGRTHRGPAHRDQRCRAGEGTRGEVMIRPVIARRYRQRLPAV